MLGPFSISPSLRFSKVPTALVLSRIARPFFSTSRRKIRPLASVRREPPFFPTYLRRSSTPPHRAVACKGGERFSSFVSTDLPPKEGNPEMETEGSDNGRDPVRLKLEDLNWDHSFVRELPGDPRTDAIPREVFPFLPSVDV